MTSELADSHAMLPADAIAGWQSRVHSEVDPELVSVLTRPGSERVLCILANEQATRDRIEARLAGARRAIIRPLSVRGAQETLSAADGYAVIEQV